MAINNPPKYRYPLEDAWDKKTFEYIQQLQKPGKYPKLVATNTQRDGLLNILLRTQKSTHGWRALLKDIVKNIRKNGEINAEDLINKYPASSITDDEPEWATYSEDDDVSDFIDELAERKIKFLGSENDAVEFIFRFIVGQLGVDWEGTILMIKEMLGVDCKIKLSDLNKELQNFDYAKIFEVPAIVVIG